MAEKQYVVFRINSEEFGIDIINIQEIYRYQQITNLPQTAEHIEGVINYRGNIIPIMDIRKKFNLGGESIVTDDTRIIIILMDEQKMGLLVDEVSQTVKIDEANIDPVPNIMNEGSDVTHVGKIGDRLVSLINIETMFAQ